MQDTHFTHLLHGSFETLVLVTFDTVLHAPGPDRWKKRDFFCQVCAAGGRV